MHTITKVDVQMIAYSNFLILYIHGFKSSCQSAKAQKLKTYFECHPDVDFQIVNYPQIEVSQSVLTLQNTIFQGQEKAKQVVLMGSSLGGFYAQYFGQRFQLPYCMINPALNPELFYEHVGYHTNSYTGEKVHVTEVYIQTLLEYTILKPKIEQPILLLMDEQDEVIDVDYAAKLYRPVKDFENDKANMVTVKIFAGGNHDFSHLTESYPLIEDWLMACKYQSKRV